MSLNNYFNYPHEFALEQGGVLEGFRLCYSTIGKLNADKSNVIWVCHALTANSNVLDWWGGLFKKGRYFDPDEYFIICANMLGGCYGSTGPLSINPESGTPYYHSFPKLTNLDIVCSFDLLRQHLGITEVHSIIGGSMGGQQALEWCIHQPDVFKNLVGLATNAKHSPWGIAFNESQRMAIAQDPSWSGGGAEAGLNGMKTARTIALLSYRAYEVYQKKQSDSDDVLDEFRASSYQRYQGEKLQLRFNAYSYWNLSKAMDAHNVGRNRNSINSALKLIKTRCHFIGISSDILFPIEEQRFLAENIPEAELTIIDSIYGHDGFLVETERINQVLRNQVLPFRNQDPVRW